MLPTHIQAWLETGQPLDSSIHPMGLGQKTSSSPGDIAFSIGHTAVYFDVSLCLVSLH